MRRHVHSIDSNFSCCNALCKGLSVRPTVRPTVSLIIKECPWDIKPGLVAKVLQNLNRVHRIF